MHKNNLKHLQDTPAKSSQNISAYSFISMFKALYKESKN